MYKVLYRAYRPETFNEMLGQKHVVKILKNQILKDKVHHAYLFCGTRGTGKTSTARLLAKGINCLDDEEKPCGACINCNSIKEGTFLDIVEIDAASHTGVNDIREIRESIKYPPAVGRKKIYIIDEVHMLSNSAFNAFLKTLEEPPAYVVFILATTEPHRLPATVLSRCLRLDFRRVPEKELFNSMEKICKDQGVIVEENALRLIVANADGSVRDGLTLLDQCISTGEKNINRSNVLEAIGTVDSEEFIRLTEASLNNSIPDGIMQIDEILSEGKDPKQILSSWLQHFRNLMLIKYISSPEETLNMSVENISRLREQSKTIGMEDIGAGIEILSETIQMSKSSSQPRILLEMAFVKLCSKKAENFKFENDFDNSASEKDMIGNSRVKQRESDIEDNKKFNYEKKNIRHEFVEVDNKGEMQSGSEDETVERLLKTLSEESGENDEISEVYGNDSLDHNMETSSNRIKDIWKQISHDAASEEPSFQMIVSMGVTISEITRNEFILKVSDEKRQVAEPLIKKYKELLERLFFKHTQEKKAMSICNSKKGIKDIEVNDDLKTMGKKLGLDIEIEEDV